MLRKSILIASVLVATTIASGTIAPAFAGYYPRVGAAFHPRVVARSGPRIGQVRSTMRSPAVRAQALAYRGVQSQPLRARRLAAAPAYARTNARFTANRYAGLVGRYARVANPHAVIRGYVGRRASYAPARTSATPVAFGGQTGSASYYSGGSHHTANGGLVGAATCAHRTLPFGTRVLVTNLANARQAVLTVNDRGPFVGGRIVDVSAAAAGTLGMLHSGTAPVRVQVVGGPG